MKSILIAVFALSSLTGAGQQNIAAIPIPMKNGIVFYEKAFARNNSISGNNFYSRTAKWLKASFPGTNEAIKIDKAAGTITTIGLFKIMTDDLTGHHYWIKSAITIYIKDDSCIYQAYNYYEKPVMPGVTNDYSKIEYRWWDFRKGKPWNQEDKALFEGLNKQSLRLIDSFENQLAR